jgi:hypothetical protein
MLCRTATAGIALAILASIGFAYGAVPPPPAHWFVSSQRLGEGFIYYTATLDRTVAYEGSSSGLLKSKSLESNTSATLMQAARATAFRGKRIKFSAYLRTRDVTQSAGLWIRAEDADGGIVAFRNSQTPWASASRVRGDSEWTRVQMIVSLPSSSVAMFYGVQLFGPGSVWIDKARFDILGDAELPSADAVPRFITGQRHRTLSWRIQTI